MGCGNTKLQRSNPKLQKTNSKRLEDTFYFNLRRCWCSRPCNSLYNELKIKRVTNNCYTHGLWKFQTPKNKYQNPKIKSQTPKNKYQTVGRSNPSTLRRCWCSRPRNSLYNELKIKRVTNNCYTHGLWKFQTPKIKSQTPKNKFQTAGRLNPNTFKVS